MATSAKKPKLRLSLLIPSSLFALAILRLSLHGFFPHPPSSSSSSSRPASIPTALLPLPKPHLKLLLLRSSVNGRSRFQHLRPSPRSRRFFARATEFFRGHCELRFFMTWISSLDGFGPREFLAMESLFKSHPNACLLLVSDTMDSSKGAHLLKPFLDKGFRVAAVAPDYNYLFKSTPAECWFEKLLNGEVDPGEVSLGQNLSNLLRLVVVYKFGGVYLDTDVIVMKSFSGLKNVIGAQAVDAATGNWSRLNNAVMVFDKMHPLVYKFIEEFALTFDGSKWGHNGPYLVSRVAARVAGRPGFEVTVLPPSAFYPVDWNKIAGLFKEPKDANYAKWVKAKIKSIRKESFAVHLWNKQSRGMNVEEGSVIGRIMLDCCVFCNFSSG
ncbi:uncharacterized protein At4g19900-like [Ananas comosus]|uniref:Uncharacterized protein At4g19900-like n=1 Tax=Ananas comosus TaxID=4615 RepID=A0A6P5H2I4_ANACO|nr:uncharacterized protein At4g19900-like [Ananas comosus]